VGSAQFSYTDNLGNYKLVRIKECYPYALKMTRDEDGTLHPSADDGKAFDAAKKRLIAAYQKNNALFSLDGLANVIANTSDIYEANGTVYIVSVYMNGRTFTEHQGDTLHDCVSLLIGAAKALRHIHNAGYLYLDLKPDNILTLEGSLDLVQLFDFDSIISTEEFEKAIQNNNPSELRISYTKGYASLEQQTGKLRQLGKHSDIYSLGAVLFYALWHKTPSAFDCDSAAVYDYAQMTYAAKKFQDRVFSALTTFFHKTLASYYADRYQNADQAIEQQQIHFAVVRRNKAMAFVIFYIIPCVFYRTRRSVGISESAFAHAGTSHFQSVWHGWHWKKHAYESLSRGASCRIWRCSLALCERKHNAGDLR